MEGWKHSSGYGGPPKTWKKEEEEEEEETTTKKYEYEDYEYECPVPDCDRRIVDKILKGGCYICGVPEHVCDDCEKKGWKHLSGHGGSPETWKEEKWSSSSSVLNYVNKKKFIRYSFA